ncbi:MAG: YvcK family protein [Candidatus Eremiobacteraeota bacterium]|nr:YvcK family protein [Candidatus Eremiobacteraeota bacterium]MBC5827125.1 YvcK family protein [Candidatus Eremiobacteraeota bacterium]
MQLKRWLFIALVGSFFLLDGLDRVLNKRGYNFHVNQTIDHLTAGRLQPFGLELILIAVGSALVYYGLRQWMRSIVHAVSPQDGQRLIEVIYERRQLSRGYRVVAIGGGTGLSTLLRGLKGYTPHLTAVVTVTDDGGSSGRLRQELGLPPPGDIRNCLVALADSESMMTDLFQYRFNEGDGLSGHSFGNLFIAAMCGIAGDFDRAVKESSRVLAIKGRVLPATLANVALEATLADGTLMRGETSVSRSASPIRSVRLVPEHCEPLPEVIDAIAEADLIVLGPGSLYTSIMPNVMVAGVAEALERSRAVKVYVCNIMTQPGETDGMSAADHVRALLDGTGRRLFDFAFFNVEQPRRLRKMYEVGGAHQVVADFDAVRALGVTPLTGNFLSEDQLVRHDAEKMAQAIVNLLVERAEWAALPPARQSAARKAARV